MPWWQPVYVAAKAYMPDVAKWVLTNIGGEWALNRIDRSVGTISERQNAIKKARQFNGKFGSILIEGSTRWVVYKNDLPIEAFPSIDGDLLEACKGYDLSRLKQPDHLPSVRARRWARDRIHGLRDLLTRDGDETVEPEGIGAASAGEGLAEAEASLGEKAFGKLIDRMPSLLQELTFAPAHLVAEHPEIPTAAGVYLFSDGPNPIYVGQSRNLRRRLREHTGLRSRENQAPLAFNIALKEARSQDLKLPRTRKEIEDDSAFRPLFASALAQVAAMKVQFLLLEDPVERTIFEIYAARALGTDEFNIWETH